MKRSTFISNVIVWGALTVACVAFLAWTVSVNGEFEDVLPLALSIYARPVLAFSLGALVATLIVKKIDLKLRHAWKLAWLILGVVPAALFLLSPLAIPLLPDTVATVFAVVLIVAMAIPVLFLIFGIFYGLSLSGLKTQDDIDAEEAEFGDAE